jgi:hypothetical protein
MNALPCAFGKPITIGKGRAAAQGCAQRLDEQRCGVRKNRAQPAPVERGRRRTRQDQIPPGRRSPGHCEPQAVRTERRKLVSSAGSASGRSSIQPFDLMSRRHPLASIRAVRGGPKIVPGRSNDVPASSNRHLDQGEIYFFLETLRVFFAVFFTALFAFFAFFAFLAIVPS